MESTNKERLKIFCNHPRWSLIIDDITHLVADYQQVKRELREFDSTFPLQLGDKRLTQDRGYVSLHLSALIGDRYILYAGEKEIYDFRCSLITIPADEDVIETVMEQTPEASERNFYGTKATGEMAKGIKPVKVGLKTNVISVDWGSVFRLEEFLRELKETVAGLKVRLQDEEKEQEESLKNFDDFVEGAAELLKEA